MSFSFEQIARSGGRLALPADTAGYLVLAATEQCLAGVLADASSITLEDSGAVTVHPRGQRVCTPAVLASLLQRLLLIASGENPRLLESASAPASELESFLDALRAALVPLNRPAARRALVRLHRQLERLGPDALALPQPPLPVEPLPVAPEPHTATEPVPVAPERARAAAEPPPLPLDASGESEPEVTEAIAVRTPRLGSLAVAPHERVRSHADPPLADSTGEQTAALWLQPASEPVPQEQTVPLELTRRAPMAEPPADEQTIPEPVQLEPVVRVEAAVPARRSDVRELVAGFRVEPAATESQLLEALQESVASHGTPLPPRAVAGRNRSGG